MEMKVDIAYRKSLDNVVDLIHREVNKSKTQVFCRTYAPVHFRGGDWRTGGSCHMETVPELGSSLVPPQTWDLYNLFGDALSAQSNKSVLGKLDILNITIMTSRRKDEPSSLYYLGSEWDSPLTIGRTAASGVCPVSPMHGMSYSMLYF